MRYCIKSSTAAVTKNLKIVNLLNLNVKTGGVPDPLAEVLLEGLATGNNTFLLVFNHMQSERGKLAKQWHSIENQS